MIAGLFLRNYKIYENFNFVHFTNGTNEKLNLLIGNNGAGKSSILEAIDTFFNDRDFIVNSNQRSKNASLAPVFLIEKSKLKNFNTAFLEALSVTFWNHEFTFLTSSNSSIENFISFREDLKNQNKQESYYLLLLGIRPNSKDVSLITFENTIFEILNISYGFTEDDSKKMLIQLYQAVKELYKYIYIPVETSISEFLKLESQGMQSLVDKELKSEIENILKNNKVKTEGKGEFRKTERNIPIINFINEKLEDYIDNIQNSIQQLEKTYHFNNELRNKRVGVKDFADVIIETYFSRRRLQKDGKDIMNLSSGERKKALIDIAYAFISQNTKTEQDIILAIDEPETSLHISMCYDQYQRIEEMANIYDKQVFVTTHWYGGLPVLNDGRLYHVEKHDTNGINVEVFSLENYFEQRKNHPDDINLKSFYDLTSSIISSVRNNGDKWLIVEGLADKKYIEHYLPDSHNYRILPVGGCPIVKKIYEYLYLPLSQDEEKASGNGKIFCLIDTDAKAISLSVKSNTDNKMLMMRRLQLDSGEIKLLKLEQGIMNVNTETELEETLNPSKFYNAFKTVVDIHGASFLTSCGTENIKYVFESYEFDNQAKFSFIKGEETFLKPLVAGRRMGNDMKELHLFFDRNKDEICQAYIKLEVGERPNWINEIITFLN